MANIIKPKRSNTAAKVPTTTDLTSGELGVNMADKKVYINNGTAVVQVGAGNLSGLGDVAITSPTSGQSLSWNGTSWVNSSAGTGTVTSVAVSGGTTGLTTSGGPITTSGTITVAGTLVVANGGTGATTANAGLNNLQGYTTTVTSATAVVLTASSSYKQYFTGSTAQTVTLPDVTTLALGRSYEIINNSTALITVNSSGGNAVTTVPAGISGVVTCILITGATAASWHYEYASFDAITGTGSCVFATSPTLVTPALGTPSSGNLANCTFPTLNQNTTGTAANVTGTVAIANGGSGATTAAAARTNFGATTVGSNLFTLTNPSAITFLRVNADNTVSALDAATFRTAIGAGTSSTTGTVTSVGGTGTVSGLTLSGTVTTSGNLTLGGTLSVTPSNFASQTANTVLAAPNGTAGTPTFRALVAADIPTLNQNTTGTASNVTGTVAVANGGTGQTSYTDGQLLIGNSTGNTLAKATLTQGTGISITNGAGSITIANSAPDQTVALTGSGATTVTGTYPNFTISSTNTTYSLATSTVAGLIELASDTAQTTAANAVTSTANRTYGLQLNASGQGVVNVPWTDTVYSLPTATTTVLGGVKLGSDTAQTTAANAVTTTASRSYALQLNASGQGVINVPWTDTVYTLPAATSTVRGGIELGSDTQQTVAANAVTSTASRTYALQVNASGQGVVNVPWTDTNSGGTVTSVGGTGTVAGISLSGTVTTSGNLTLGGTFALPNGQVTGKMIYDSFTATASQTTFTTSTTYTSGKIEVYVNGVKLRNGTDVTVTSGTSVVMATGLAVGSLVDLVYPT